MGDSYVTGCRVAVCPWPLAGGSRRRQVSQSIRHTVVGLCRTAPIDAKRKLAALLGDPAFLVAKLKSIKAIKKQATWALA